MVANRLPAVQDWTTPAAYPLKNMTESKSDD